MKCIVGFILLFCFSAQAIDWGSDNKDVQKSIEDIFVAQARVLDKSSTGALHTKNWNFTNLILELGISHSGKLGLLAFRGTAAASAFWGKKGVPVTAKEGTTYDLHLSTDMSPQDVRDRAWDLADAIFGIGRIDNPHIFRRHMYELFSNFYVVAQILAAKKTKGWKVSRLYFERSVSASGDIIPIFIKQSQFRFRVMWDIANGAKHKLPPELETRRSRLQGKLQKLIGEFAEDLHYTANELPPAERINLKSFKIGLGISKSHDFLGIVKNRQSATGLIEFAFDHKDKSSPILKGKGRGTLPFLKSNHSRNDFLESQGVDREDLRKGLAAALRLSSSMFRHSQNHGSLGWDMNRLDVSFEMSIRGQNIVSNVDGKGTSVISFSRN